MISMSPSKSFLRRLCLRNFCSGGGASSELIGRPILMLPPSYSAAVEEKGGISPPLKLMQLMKYNFYSPLKKIKGDACYYKNNPHPLKKDMVKDRDILRFYSRGGKEEVALMQDKDTNWVGSSHGWLGLFNKNNRSMSLINPVSGRRIHLPPLGEEKKKRRQYPVKVILSHSPDDENCRALAIHGKYEFHRKAAVCSPGRSERWSPLGGRWNKPSRSRYNDFVYSASLKAFVSSTHVSTGWLGLGRATDELEFWDVESRTEAPVKTTRAPLASLWDAWQTYLVTEEESGQLFMVRRYVISHDKNMVEYNVYRIESYFGGLDLQLCESLDDLVMFVGMNHSFAVKASRFPEYRPNCIYFSGGWNWKNGSRNKPLADIYDYKSKDYSPLFYSFSGHDFPFDHKLPWFNLTEDKDCTVLDK